MIVAFQMIGIATFACAAIVIFGALYALFLALGHLKNRAHYIYLSYTAYLALVLSTWLLVEALQLTRWWLILIAILLVGYLIAPRIIWRLSVAVHGAKKAEIVKDGLYGADQLSGEYHESK
jgi:FlaA1/EpsC-like NDP-sugar epimerase